MANFLTDTGNTWMTRQDGVARYGLLAFTFVSERERRLEPMKHIATRNDVSGTSRRMQSEATFVNLDQGVRITYYAEIVPDSLLARMFGQALLWHEVRQRLAAMSKEMLRRYAIVARLGGTSAIPALPVEAN